MLPQKPGIKLPELPLFGKGIFSLGHLPKFWEAILSGWRAPEPISNPVAGGDIDTSREVGTRPSGCSCGK